MIEAPAGDDEHDETGYSPVIIAEATTSLKRFSVSEAVMELDLTGAACLVFQHGSSGRVNIIYRRPDGNVGWIDPPVLRPGDRRGAEPALTASQGASLWSAAFKGRRIQGKRPGDNTRVLAPVLRWSRRSP